MNAWSKPTIPPRERDNAAIKHTGKLLEELDARILSHGSEDLPAWLVKLQQRNVLNTTDKTCVLTRIRRENFPREVMWQIVDVLP